MAADLSWRFAPDVHGAVDSGNLVLLDVAADAYFCLPGAGSALAPGPVGNEVGRLPEDLLHELAQARLIRQTSEDEPQASPVFSPNSDCFAAAPAAFNWRDGAAFAKAYVGLAPRFYRRPFDQVLAHARARRLRLGTTGATEGVVARAKLFNAMMPWSPVQGACLLQAAWMLEFLAGAGLTADWVFGVRTWPFSAHCWVQAGEVVLNDTLERVAPYRVILRV
ncbi:lasso peptide biosynthesis B2 protein [Phenylobacterium sp.]|uniref:lasso peptide biosynthesis B2 protein n=1 Tax=Phenylobacterium sp. TaxID=1871053 RepID=UPI0035B43810